MMEVCQGLCIRDRVSRTIFLGKTTRDRHDDTAGFDGVANGLEPLDVRRRVVVENDEVDRPVVLAGGLDCVSVSEDGPVGALTAHEDSDPPDLVTYLCPRM